MSTAAQRRARAAQIQKVRAEKLKADRERAAKKAAIRRQVTMDAAAAKRARVSKEEAKRLSQEKNKLASKNASASSKMQRQQAKRIAAAKKKEDAEIAAIQLANAPREAQPVKQKGNLKGFKIGAVSYPDPAEVNGALNDLNEELAVLKTSLSEAWTEAVENGSGAFPTDTLTAIESKVAQIVGLGSPTIRVFSASKSEKAEMDDL